MIAICSMRYVPVQMNQLPPKEHVESEPKGILKLIRRYIFFSPIVASVVCLTGPYPPSYD